MSFSFISKLSLTIGLSLKTEYTSYVRELKATGAGLHSEDVIPGSDISNRVGKYFFCLATLF
jgi:hypothetical protein